MVLGPRDDSSRPVSRSGALTQLRVAQVLITGAGSGIGRLMALLFAKEGCNLALWDINEAGVQETGELSLVRCVCERRGSSDAPVFVGPYNVQQRIATRCALAERRRTCVM